MLNPTPSKAEDKALAIPEFDATLDPTKPVRTKCGYPVRILAVDRSLTKGIIGVIDAEHFRTSVESWGFCGNFQTNGTPGGLDLENCGAKPDAVKINAALLSAAERARDALTEIKKRSEGYVCACDSSVGFQCEPCRDLDTIHSGLHGLAALVNEAKAGA